MSLLHNKSAGKPLRRRAQQLRTKALYRYVAAPGMVLLPLLVYVVAPFEPLFLVAALLIGTLIALPLIEEGKKFWKSSRNFDQGAYGEEKTQQVLESLIKSGWIVEYNLRLPKVGDIDVWLRSPKGINFILNVKSHSTEVVLDGDVLKRRYYGKLTDFEKDFVAQITKEAKALKKDKKLTKVTPLVVFSDAKVNISHEKKIKGTYVIGLGDLVSKLRELDRNSE
jgi:Nuclease-related domain